MKGEEEYDYTEEVDISSLQSSLSIAEWMNAEGRSVIQPIFFDFSRLYVLSPTEHIDQSISKIDYILSLLAMPFSFELKRVELLFGDNTLCLTDCPSNYSSEYNRYLLLDVHSIKMTCELICCCSK